jgi:Glyoxalase-like domain
VLTGIDHLILAARREDITSLEERLYGAGFRRGDGGSHVGGATANSNVYFAKGAFIELLFEQATGSGPNEWFARVPRIQGVGFMSTDLRSDAEAWSDSPEAWDREFSRVRDDGVTTTSHAAGPVRMGEFYVFAMDRAEGRYADDATPQLVRLEFRGRDADVWATRLHRWLRLEPSGDGRFVLNNLEFLFEADDEPAVNVSPTFRVRQGDGLIPLANAVLALERQNAGPGSPEVALNKARSGRGHE